MNLFKNESLLITILILFSVSLFITGLGVMALTDPDEVFYAETAKEMLERKEMLTPYIFGEPQFEKPPLYYWSVILAFKVFGVNEFSARIPSAVFGILGVLGIYFLGKVLVNKRTGFFAGITLATSVMYIVLARACVTDMLLALLILFAFLFFFCGYRYERGKRASYLLSSVFLALAVLTKGPVGLFLPVVIIGIYMLLTGAVKKLKEIPFLKGALLFLAVILPWYILMYKAHGKEFLDVFFGFHNINRFLHPEHAWGDVFYYNVPIVIGGFFPWSAFLPLGIWQAARESDKRIRGGNAFLITWFLVIFVFFSISRTKLPTYIFPLYPALALLMGRLLDVALGGGLTQKMKKGMLLSFCLFFALLIGGVIGLYFTAARKYPAVTGASLEAGIVFILFMLALVAAFLKKRYTASLVIFGASFIILTFTLAYIVLPGIGDYASSKKVSEKLLTLAKPQEEIGAETRYRRGVAFYTGRENVPDVHPHHVITEFLNKNKRVWCVIKEKNHIFLYTDKKTPYNKPSYVMYQVGKKIIVTNKLPAGARPLKVRTIDEPY